VIPIANARGRTVAYAGRAPDDSLPKYKLPNGFRKAWELFNLHRAAATGSKTVIVVEGLPAGSSSGDAAGRAASRAIATRLSRRCWVAEVPVPDGTQPDQLSLVAIQQLLG